MELNKKMKEFEKKLNNCTFELLEIAWDDAVKKYAENLLKNKIIIEELLNNEYFKKMKEEIEDIQINVDNYIINAKNPEYQIAIVGAIKAGKSTLINSLLGYDLASVDVTPETATLTKIKASDKSYIKTSFYTTEEWDKIWKQANDFQKKAKVFLKEYDEIEADEVKDLYLNKKEIKIETENYEELKNEIKKWTSSKAKEHYFVKEIEIGLKELKLNKQICIVDTPGLNDIVAYRSDITLDYIGRANAVIVCVNAKTLRNEEMVTIARVFSQAKYKKEKIYVLGTQIDTLNSVEDWSKQKKEWEKSLFSNEYFQNKELIENNLLGVSAFVYNILNGNNLNRNSIAKYEAMELITEEEADDLRYALKNQLENKVVLSKKTIEKIENFSNINRIKEIIFKDLISEFNKALLNDYFENYNIIINKIIDFKDKNKKNLRTLLDSTSLTKDELDDVVIENKKKLEKMKFKISEISKNIDKVTDTFNCDFSKLSDKFVEIKEEIKKIKID